MLCHKKYNRLLENKIISITKSLYCKTVSSGTAGLHIALRALNVRMYDKVLCSSFSFIATATPILYIKAIPVFIDSEMTSWNICPRALEKALIFYKKKKNPPRVLIIAHSYGTSANMELILQICKYYNIKIIEDAASSLGSHVHNKFLGTIGQIGVYSFNMNKIITSCSGGAVVTNSVKLYNKMKLLSMHAKSKNKKIDYYYKELGYNYSMNSISAAIGYCQAQDIIKKITQKRYIYNVYYKIINQLTDRIVFQKEINSFSNRWLTCIYSYYESNNFLILKNIFKKKKIEFRNLWYPLHLQPLFSSCDFFNITNPSISYLLFTGGLCLPSSYNINITDQYRIINIITNYINNI
jgi:pyridoxal phosphate-dependent aminotransferase EpsN